MSEKQVTFGNVEVRELNELGPICTDNTLDGSNCGNRAVIVIDNSLDSELQYRCESHAKQYQLERCNYYD